MEALIDSEMVESDQSSMLLVTWSSEPSKIRQKLSGHMASALGVCLGTREVSTPQVR